VFFDKSKRNARMFQDFLKESAAFGIVLFLMHYRVVFAFYMILLSIPISMKWFFGNTSAYSFPPIPTPQQQAMSIAFSSS
jgi:hypothetical protein